MNLLLEEIRLEKFRTQAELGYIQRIQQLSDKAKGSDALSFAHFISTGRIYPRDAYLIKYKKRRSSVHKDTQLVVVYMLGVKVDRLLNGTYHTMIANNGKPEVEVMDKNSKKIEQMLYNQVCNINSTKVAQSNNI